MRHISRLPEACMNRILLIAVGLLVSGGAWAQAKPNILIIWGDDIGIYNTSA